jgi:uncharacterized protein YjbI with pentapeptide repeats
MADEEQQEILRKGTGAWNRWREQNPDARLDLVGAELEEADLDGADLRHSVISGANLARAHLNNADFQGAALIGAHLGRSNLYQRQPQ